MIRSEYTVTYAELIEDLVYAYQHDYLLVTPEDAANCAKQTRDAWQQYKTQLDKAEAKYWLISANELAEMKALELESRKALLYVIDRMMDGGLDVEEISKGVPMDLWDVSEPVYIGV